MKNPTNATKNSRGADLQKICKGCGKKKQNHTRMEALRCGE